MRFALKVSIFFVLLMTFSVQASVSVSVNGTSYTIPQTNEKGWGTNVTNWIQAMSLYTLQPSGGTFTLTAEVDTGATYGFKVPYIKTETSTPSTAGVLRLAKTDSIGWRNNANGGNLLLAINGSDQLTFNSVVLPTATTGASFQDSTFSLYDNVDSTKLVAFQVSGVTTGTTRTLTVPDATTTIVGIDVTQTLTNKTIAAGSNTLSGIANANLSGSAAISNANLATMNANTVKANITGGAATPTDVSLVSTNTASSAVFRDGSGNFSAGTITATLTGTASGNLTYTASNHGVLVSGSGNTVTVVGPDSSTVKALISGGSSADPAFGVLAIGGGGTGQTSKANAFDALSPLTTGGDLLYGGASGTGTRLANGSSGNYLKSAGGTSAPAWAAFTAHTTTILTNGSGATYSTPSTAKAIWVRCVGAGGGGGGGATTDASHYSAGAGGGGGGYAEKWIASPSASYTYTVSNSGGTAGSAGNNAGGNGTTTTFSDGGSTSLSAGGGTGGSGSAAGTAVPAFATAAGGAGGTGSGGDVNANGGKGSPGLALSLTQVAGGGGGGSLWSNTMPYINPASVAAGAAASGYGGGGGGAALTASQTQQAGGVGTAGLCVVHEFYNGN